MTDCCCDWSQEIQIYRGCLNPPPLYLYAVITNSFRNVQYWDKQPAVAQLTWSPTGGFGAGGWTGTFIGDESYTYPFDIDHAITVSYLGGIGQPTFGCPGSPGTRPPIVANMGGLPFTTASDIPACQFGCCEPLTWRRKWYTGNESYHLRIFSTFELAEAQRLEWQRVTGCISGQGSTTNSSIQCNPGDCPASFATQMVCTFSSSNCPCWNGLEVVVDWYQHEEFDVDGLPPISIGLGGNRTAWFGTTTIESCTGDLLDGDTNYYVHGVCATQGASEHTWFWSLHKFTDNVHNGQGTGLHCFMSSQNQSGTATPNPGGACGANGGSFPFYSMLGGPNNGIANGACCDVAFKEGDVDWGNRIIGTMTAIPLA